MFRLKEDDVLTVGLNRAVSLIAESPGHNAIELGDHPEDGKPISIRKGRYGPYIKHGRVNATVPKDREPETITLDEALALLAEKVSKSKTKKTAAAKKKTAKAAPKKKAGAAKKKKPTKKTKKSTKEKADAEPANDADTPAEVTS